MSCIPFVAVRPLCWMALVCLAAGGLPGARAQTQSRAAAAPGALSRTVAIHLKNVPFDVALRTLARLGVRCIADGWPKIPSANVEYSGDVKGALDTLGKTFGYNWSQARNGVILFRKSFDVHGDYPQMLAPEIRQWVREMLVVLPMAPADAGDAGWSNEIRVLNTSLTPDQVEQLRSGKRLPVRDLTQQQAALVRTIVFRAAFGPPRFFLQRLLFQMENVQSSQLVSDTRGTWHVVKKGNTEVRVPLGYSVHGSGK